MDFTGRARSEVRARGINYDTGSFPGAQFTRTSFDPANVRREMAVVAEDLHCDVVRVSGREAERLSVAAHLAAEAGLEVWFSPFPVDLTAREVLGFFEDCARRAEAVRLTGAEVVFVAGCEMSIFCTGFLPGETYAERLQAMLNADIEWWTSLGPVFEGFNAFLSEAAEVVRSHFTGRITYAAGPWEWVRWEPFDVVSIDAYRAQYNVDTFVDTLREAHSHGKPLVISEFGTCAYRGAGDLGGMAWQPPLDAVADEEEQVRYLEELLDVFESEGVDTALWFSFANYDKPGERDIASYGVVRLLDDTQWVPKEVFFAMAERYQRR